VSADYTRNQIAVDVSAPEVRIREGMAFAQGGHGLDAGQIAAIARAQSANRTVLRLIASRLPISEEVWSRVREVVCFRLESGRPWMEAIVPYAEALGFSADASWYLGHNAGRYGDADSLTRRLDACMSRYEAEGRAPQLPDYLPCPYLRACGDGLEIWKLEYADRAGVERKGVVQLP